MSIYLVFAINYTDIGGGMADYQGAWFNKLAAENVELQLKQSDAYDEVYTIQLNADFANNTIGDVEVN